VTRRIPRFRIPRFWRLHFLILIWKTDAWLPLVEKCREIPYTTGCCRADTYIVELFLTRKWLCSSIRFQVMTRGLLAFCTEVRLKEEKVCKKALLLLKKIVFFLWLKQWFHGNNTSYYWGVLTCRLLQRHACARPSSKVYTTRISLARFAQSFFLLNFCGAIYTFIYNTIL